MSARQRARLLEAPGVAEIGDFLESDHCVGKLRIVERQCGHIERNKNMAPAVALTPRSYRRLFRPLGETPVYLRGSEMNDVPTSGDIPDGDQKSRASKWIRAGMNTASGFIPFAGGFISAAAGVWSENEQEEALSVLRAWVKMLEDELHEKQQTMLDVMARLDMHDEEIAARVRSDEYQSLLKKAFRNWAGTESRKKQEYIRNILTNAAATRVVSDDVVFLFMEWLQDYSEFHFAVIAELYKREGITRSQIWENLGRARVREDSADADLYKLLIRDLSTGGIIRQHRETDYQGNFINRAPQRSGPRPKSAPGAAKVAKSAFDDEERYELTALGKQFVHYAMTELTLKLQYHPDFDFSGREGEPPSPTPSQPTPGDAG